MVYSLIDFEIKKIISDLLYVTNYSEFLKKVFLNGDSKLRTNRH